MAYVKNCDPGKITMDLPSSNYIYELPLLSIGDNHGPFNLSLIFNRTMAKNGTNPFAMAAGYKLNIHKVLNFDNSLAPYLLDADGNCVDLIDNSGVYTFNDDSQRILRTGNPLPNPYIVENPDFSLEYYNQYGYITSIVDKYGVEILAYSYNASKQLTSITFRGDKLIEFTYSSGKMTKVRYQGSTYSTSLSLGTSSATVTHYSGETYSLTYSEDVKFQASTTVTENSTTITNTIRAENTTNKTVKITKLIGGNTVDTMTYVFPDIESYPGEKFSQVEITNNDGVKTRVQYQFGKPLYSYEIGSDAEFDSAMYLGTVNIYNTVDSLLAGHAASALTRNDGIQMTGPSDNGQWQYQITNFTGGNVNGYFVLTGWVRAKEANTVLSNTLLHISSHTGGSEYDFYPRIVADTKWKFFAYKFYAGNMNSNYLYVYPQNSSKVELKDLRLMFQATDFLKEDDKSRVVMAEDVLIDSQNNCIPIRGSAFKCNGEAIVCREFHETIDLNGDNDCVAFEDLLRYKVNQLKGTNTKEFYYNRGKNVIVAASGGTAQVTTNGTTYHNLSNYRLGKRTYTTSGTVLTHILEDDEGFLTCEVIDTDGEKVLSRQILNEYLDVVEKTEFDHSGTTVKSVTTTYERSNDLVTKEAVSGLYTRETTYGKDASGNTTVTAKDEFNKQTVYTLDPVWGAVISVKLPNGALVTDTYDDDMCALTKRTFGSASGRSNTLTYSSGNLSGLTSGALAYGFTYSAGKLTGVSKNSTSVEAHIHTGNSKTESYYPKQSSALHSTINRFDKYGRLSKIDGVLSNTYDLSPSFTSAGALNATEDNGSAHLAMTIDELAGQTTRYDYNERGLLAHQKVTAKSSYSNKISNEAFTYDDLDRLVDYTATYDVANNKRVGATITYAKDTGTAAANHVVGTFNYKVNGASKAVTTNTFDDYNRLEQKTITFGSKTFTRTINYGATRVDSVQDKLSTTNLGKNAYTYDSLGRILKDEYTSSKSSSDNKKYTYDQYGQLVREDNQGLAKTFVYAYNNIGNLISVKAYNYTTGTVSGTPVTTSFGYSADKLTSFGGSSISYNTMGCPTSYDGMSATWSKGKLSRLSSGTLASGTTNYTYSYNGFGQRVSKTYSFLEGTNGLNPVQTGQVINYSKQYYYDHAGRLIAETINKSYYNASATVEHIVYLYDENSIVGIDYTSNGATYRYFFQRNLQGDVTAIFNTSGTIMAKYLYDAWGNCTISSETTNYAVANANPIRYRGYYYDDDTGLYYCNARYYSPKWRRFISPDDTAYLDPESVNGLNLYCYCNNDPINYCDPSGHWVETVFDLFSLGASVVEVVINPADPWAWAGLVGDAVDLLPFVTGVGEGVKAAKLVKYADDAVDASLATIKFTKAVDYASDFAEGGLDIARALDRTSDGFTIANRLDGIKIHKSFMNNGLNIRGTRLRVDGLDDVAKRVYELKPYNRRNLRQGVKQILNYNDKLGGCYEMIIVFY